MKFAQINAYSTSAKRAEAARAKQSKEKSLTVLEKGADIIDISAGATKAQTEPLSPLELILESLDDSKAEETVSIDITGKSPLADHLIITSGRSHRHVSAVADRLLRDLKDGGFGTPKIEGMPACDWVLIDTGDVIVHVFRPEVRDFYNLEKMWRIVAESGEAH